MQQGTKVEQWLGGEIVVTQRGIVFLEATGLFKTSRMRHHAIPFSAIVGARIETRGITGAFTGQVFLAIDFSTGVESVTRRYSCSRSEAERICAQVNERVQVAGASRELPNEILRLVKPRGEIGIQELIEAPSILNMIAKIHGRPIDQSS